MSNLIRDNNAAPANLGRLLAGTNWISSADLAAFRKIKADADRLMQERSKFSRDVLDIRLHSLRTAAAADPSEENISELTDFTTTFAEASRTNEQNVGEIMGAHTALLKRARPLFRRMGEAAIPAIERAMQAAEDQIAEIAHNCGVEHVPGDSSIFRSLAQALGNVRSLLVSETGPQLLQVETVAALLGIDA